MKKLSIEEKARAYDEAIRKAKITLGCCDSTSIVTKNTVYDIFPELKESEDESIKKFIKEQLYKIRSTVVYNSNLDIELANAIAWLEKQVDKPQGKTALEVAKEEKIDNANKVGPKLKVKYACGEYNVVDIKDITGVTFYGIEDEPNHIDYIQAENCEIISGYDIKENGSPYPTKPAVFSEQKPIDEVEAKFHEGEWIIRNAEHFKHNAYLIKEVKNYYVLEDLEGRRVAFTFNDVHKNFKLWDISDAKEGNVLNSPSHRLIWIYKDNGHYHVCVNMNYVTKNVATNDLIIIPSDACPATKNERTILFEKTKEAGYEWDAEKKELKKIEQEPTEWHREDEQNLNACLGYIPDEFLRRWLQDAIHTKYDKAAWSEEYEKLTNRIEGWLDTLCDYLKDSSPECIEDVKDVVEHLNSLRPQKQ